ncbi:nitroreductase family protein [Candidatus Woesearchaeota archaeon]|nr:nitroreductase family protein [Candidatus Woesearchaeota archaeon]
MDAREAIITRRSVREYKDKDIGLSTIEEIIDAGRYAPSAGNIQLWRVIVVKDERVKNKIARLAMKQSWISQAPAVLVVCSNKTTLKSYYGKRADKYAMQTISAAVQNMLIRANSLGVGTCWVDTFESKALKRELRIPEDTNPEVIITLGYSDKKARASLKVDLNKIVYFERWGNLEVENKILKELSSKIKKKINENKKKKKN